MGHSEILLLKIAGPTSSMSNAARRKASGRNQIRSAMRGGEGGGDVSCVAGKTLNAEIALGRNETGAETDWVAGFISVDTMAGSCCCAVQQEGRV
jgi:hypothetical protein